MYALVLATLFTTANDVPDFGRHGCRGGCWGCSGCYGGCYGCYGGCYGCYGGCYGCYGGCSGCWGCFGGGGSFACYGGCGGGISYGGGCFGGVSYGGGCFGGVSYGGCTGGGGGGGTGGAPGGGGSGASGGSSAGSSTGQGGGGQGGGGGASAEAAHALRELKKSLETMHSLEELKKSLAELKKEQERLRVDALKQVADELRLKATEQKIDELRRAIEELKQRPAKAPPTPLPLPLPAPKGRPELPAPKAGEVRLEMPADALLVVNGKPIAVAPAYRTPPIQPGAEYVCTFEATVVRDGKNITRVKRLPLRAGAEVRLTFADMEPAEEHWTKMGESAHFTVRLPADARLTVDDVECPLTSGSRTFDTPSLVPGREYFYTLKAEMVRDGRRIAQTKRVAFRPGERVTVSFEEQRAEGVAAQ